jgi:hypothetical protein
MAIRRCSVCLEATAPLRMAALSIALSLIVQWSAFAGTVLLLSALVS